METSNVPILVVDDSQSATSQLEHILFNANFFNVHFCQGAIEAVQFLENNPTQILLASWQLRDLDGLELAEHVRELDAELNHFTYIILYSDQEPDDHIRQAFKTRIDHFLRKTDLQTQLPGIMFAAERITAQFDDLLSTRHELEIECTALRAGIMRDPLTGLGNDRQTMQSLNDTIRQIEARGGAVCFLLIGIEGYRQLLEEHSSHIMNELLVAIAKRLLHLVRPLDVVTYFDEGQFALVLLQPSIEQCTPDCYRRIFDGIRLKSYMTSAGYLTVKIGMSICASEALTGPPQAEAIIKTAMDNLPQSFNGGDIQVAHLNAEDTFVR
jgi:diguanylate cyclase (GGDEF)-like protein